MAKEFICDHTKDCAYKHVCAHSKPHKEHRNCFIPYRCFRESICIEYKVGATGAEVLEGLFPIIKKDTTEATTNKWRLNYSTWSINNECVSRL